jgi:hypothetical protein
MKKYIFVFVLLFSSLFLSACGQKTAVKNVTPTPVPREMNLTDEEKPKITLTPRADGHEITLDVTKISSKFSKIEYELIYSALDNGLEIEKGVSGNVESKDMSNGSFQRKVLLGTESCTSGCKYKYDEGVVGGTIILTLNTTDNQVASLENTFKLTQVKGKGFVITLDSQ